MERAGEKADSGAVDAWNRGRKGEQEPDGGNRETDQAADRGEILKCG